MGHFSPQKQQQAALGRQKNCAVSKKVLELVNNHWVKLVNTQMENLNYETVIVLVVLSFYLIYTVRLGFSFDLKNSSISYTTETKWKEKIFYY